MKHAYVARIRASQGLLIARIYRDDKLVMDYTARDVTDAKNTMYRHYVRLAELDEIEENAKVS